MRVPSILCGVVVSVSTLAALLVTYPWATYSRFDFPRWTIASSYAVVAISAGLVAATAVAVVRRRASLSSVGKGVACAGACLAVGILFATLLGPLGRDVPFTIVSGIFFSEWKFVTFTFCVAVPASLLAGVMCTVLSLRGRR